MALELALHGGNPDWPGFDATHVAEARATLLAKTTADPDFWSVTNLVEMDLYEAVAAQELSLRRGPIECGLQDLHARLPCSTEWRSVADQGELVLAPYIQRSSDSDREAAQALLALVKGYAA